MKKLIYLLLILSFSLVSKAQTWCPVGAKWHYRLYNPITPYYDGVLELNYTNTLTINSIVCKEIIGTFYGKTIAAWSPSTIITNYVNIKTYSNNNVYYKYDIDENKFDTIVDFNASVGDKWLLTMLPTGTSTSNPCSFSRPTVSVTNTGTLVINSQTLRKIEVTFTTYTNSVYTRTIIEKIGSDIGFLFPSYHCIVDGPEYGDFICYEDPNFPLYKKTSVVNCIYDPTSIEENSTDYNICISPNPSSSEYVVNFKSGDLLEFKFFDAFGKEFFVPYNLVNNVIHLDFTKIDKGIYFVNFYKYTKLIITKKIIKL